MNFIKRLFTVLKLDYIFAKFKASEILFCVLMILILAINMFGLIIQSYVLMSGWLINVIIAIEMFEIQKRLPKNDDVISKDKSFLNKFAWIEKFNFGMFALFLLMQSVFSFNNLIYRPLDSKYFYFWLAHIMLAVFVFTMSTSFLKSTAKRLPVYVEYKKSLNDKKKSKK